MKKSLFFIGMVSIFHTYMIMPMDTSGNNSVFNNKNRGLHKELHKLSFALQRLTTFLVNNTAQKQKMHESLVLQKLGYGWKDKKSVITVFKDDIARSMVYNKHIPKKTKDIFRIMSYNVHFWKTPDGVSSNEKALWGIIHELQPDVLIMQEVSGKNDNDVRSYMQKKGYPYVALSNTVKHGWFGNLIASKIKPYCVKNYHFKNQEHSHESRGYSYIVVRLPNGKDLHIYGTHLEVGKLKNYDVERLRSNQLQEIYSYIHSYLADKNVLIAGDFNEVRHKTALQKIFLAGFYDSFTALGWQHPLYTSMYGNEIDFMLFNKNFNLSLAGAYVYYSVASDHLPLIVDIDLSE